MRDFFFKDFGWKLFSLLLAAFIWYTVHKIIEEPQGAAGGANTIPVTYGEMPVMIVAAATDTNRYRVNPDKVSVSVSGPSEVMSVLKANEILATVDVAGIESVKDLERPVEVAVPPGVTLVNVNPPTVTVILPPKP